MEFGGRVKTNGRFPEQQYPSQDLVSMVQINVLPKQKTTRVVRHRPAAWSVPLARPPATAAASC